MNSFFNNELWTSPEAAVKKKSPYPGKERDYLFDWVFDSKICMIHTFVLFDCGFKYRTEASAGWLTVNVASRI